MSLAFTIAATLRPLTAGFIRDQTGSYQVLVWLCIGLGVLAWMSIRSLNATITAQTG